MHHGIHAWYNPLQKYLASTWYILDGKILRSYRGNWAFVKQGLSITGQSITGQKFHNSLRVSQKSVSSANLVETCVQLDFMHF